MTVLLVHGSMTQQAAREVLQRRQDEIVVLEIDAWVPCDLCTSSISIRHYESYLNQDDYKDLDKSALDMSLEWARNGYEDLSVWKGVSIAEVTRRPLFCEIVQLLKNIECANKALTRERPSLVYLGAGVSLNRWAWLRVAEDLGMECIVLPLDADAQETEPIQPTRNVSHPKRVLRALKHTILKDWIGSTILWNIANLWSTVEAMVAWYARRRGKQVIAATPFEHRNTVEWHRQVRARPRIQVFPTLRWIHLLAAQVERRDVNDFLSYFHKIFESAIRRGAFEFRAIDFSDQLRPAFDEVLAILPHLLTQTSFFERRVELLRPSIVVCDWAIRYSEIAFTQLSQQSGVPVLRFGRSWHAGKNCPSEFTSLFLDIVSDYAFFWGPIGSSTYDLEDLARVRTTHAYELGAPPSLLRKLEEAHGSKAHPPQTEPDENYRFVVLFTAQYWSALTAFLSPLDTRLAWRAVLHAARHCPDVMFLVKTHPYMESSKGESSEGRGAIRSLCRNLGDSFPANFRILPVNTDFYSVLPHVDLVISQWSTTLVEASVLDIPVITVNLSGKPDPQPEFVESGCALGVRHQQDLPEAIYRALTDPPTINSMKQGRKRFLAMAFSPPCDVGLLVEDIIRHVSNSSSEAMRQQAKSRNFS